MKNVDYSESEGLVIRMVLQNGSRGDDVKTLQQNLMMLGYSLPRYGADGSFGSETLAALKLFQTDHGLPNTGIVDEATEEALAAALETKPDLSARVDALEAAVKELQERLNI